MGLRPQKGFGQNFLLNEYILERIVEAGDLQPDDVVLEVGPGLGHLTRHLAARAGRVIAIEIDRGMVRALRQIFQNVPNVEILEQDVLQVTPGNIVGDHPYKVIANLPYYITSATLRHFLEADPRPQLMVVLVQREVAFRILAPPGESNLLAISVQAYGRPRLVARVPSSAFYPRPKVDSIVLRIDVFDRPRFDVSPDAFFKVVAAGFAMPRKQIHNALAQRLWLPPGAAPDLLREAGIDPMRRAQTLAIPEWNRLGQVLVDRGLV
jgi:16S rRNA (adenine1518-N6/adenine1519-N6)-dimethyltransferase